MLAAPHHDGSPAYCPDPPQEHGDRFTVLLRTSADDPVTPVAVRQVHDGEPFYVEARVDRRTPSGTWWRAELVAHNTVSNYRFLLDGGSTGYRWLSAAGVVEADVPDGGDFRVALAPEAPAWLDDAIVYQMLPRPVRAQRPGDRAAARLGRSRRLGRRPEALPDARRRGSSSGATSTAWPSTWTTSPRSGPTPST